MNAAVAVRSGVGVLVGMGVFVGVGVGVSVGWGVLVGNGVAVLVSVGRATSSALAGEQLNRRIGRRSNPKTQRGTDRKK